MEALNAASQKQTTLEEQAQKVAEILAQNQQNLSEQLERSSKLALLCVTNKIDPQKLALYKSRGKQDASLVKH